MLFTFFNCFALPAREWEFFASITTKAQNLTVDTETVWKMRNDTIGFQGILNYGSLQHFFFFCGNGVQTFFYLIQFSFYLHLCVVNPVQVFVTTTN